MVQKIKEEIDRRWRELANKNVKTNGGVYDYAIYELLSLLRYIEDLENEEKNETR